MVSIKRCEYLASDKVRVPRRTTLIQLLIAAMLSFIFSQALHERFTREDRPVEFFGFEIRHPVLPGAMLSVEVDAQVHRQCSALAVWIVTDSTGMAVWQYQARVGYTPAGPRRKLLVSPPVPLPAYLPDGNYILTINRTDNCPERSYAHPPYQTAFLVP